MRARTGLPRWKAGDQAGMFAISFSASSSSSGCTPFFTRAIPNPSLAKPYSRSFTTTADSRSTNT